VAPRFTDPAAYRGDPALRGPTRPAPAAIG
jgi:hypothetical protein